MQVEMGFEFQMQSEKGALLVLPRGGNSLGLQKHQKLEDYVRTNSKNWYRFVNGAGPFKHDVPNGTLGLISKLHNLVEGLGALRALGTLLI